MYYLNRTGAYEVRNILSEESLRSTLLWLSSELPCSNEKMKEAYAEMRAKLSLQILADFNERYVEIENTFYTLIHNSDFNYTMLWLMGLFP